jgi:hypothetical protein
MAGFQSPTGGVEQYLSPGTSRGRELSPSMGANVAVHLPAVSFLGM